MMMSKVLRFGKRQLHTIVSRDMIKPSSPTPCHLKAYNLSVYDQLAPSTYMPIVVFYPSSNIHQSPHDTTLELKNSLSKTLTQYYPFAGRLKENSPSYVDCNDNGVEFIEASNDNVLSDFIQHSKHEELDQLFPNDLICFHPYLKLGDKQEDSITCPLSVQVNHFACGGVAVATSLHHKFGDARSIFNFINHWARVNAALFHSRDIKDASLVNPHLIYYQNRNTNLPEMMASRSRVGCVTTSFSFPNEKLKELKAKVTAMTVESGQPIMNPTRVEVLTWLIHKCAIRANTKTNSGAFTPTGMVFPVDMRNILVEKLPGTTIGNIILMIDVPTRNGSEFEPHMTIGELRKRKTQFQSIRNFEAATGPIAEMSTETILEISNGLNNYYVYSSLCGFPTYGIDFGWGKPVKVTMGGTMKNFILLMDTPNDDGIEATVCLEEQDMKTFQNDPELLAFC
ncbi:deacetylvindoline O-acetyltransferase [Artemisia annua]|uniref:Deacetylvindoline O-acetyltransferase n=1 Tax=Artemisia annua TaxID=35608 RepID=A0A2U1PZ93_ARTAN|nr:deacetylvindoline O-acetyltransferase [Artemisia annua]